MEKRLEQVLREGRQGLRASCTEAGWYHSGAAREDRAGTSRYRGHERRSADRKQGGTMELSASPLN